MKEIIEMEVPLMDNELLKNQNQNQQEELFSMDEEVSCSAEFSEGCKFSE